MSLRQGRIILGIIRLKPAKLRNLNSISGPFVICRLEVRELLKPAVMVNILGEHQSAIIRENAGA